MNATKIIGFIFIGVACFLFIFVAARNVDMPVSSPVFSDKSMLEALWNNYKNDYIEKDTGRALDISQNNITTSEGQSYTLLRAVWMDDKPAFDTAFKWTMDNLKRDEDHLFSWLFGEKEDGTYGVLTDKGGYNSATDADTDIALALIFAHSRWGDPYYLDTATEILKSVWEKEVLILNDKPYLTANNLEKFSSQKPIINPSYFSPYAYRIFAEVDKDHDWMGLVDTSYEILEKTASSTLDKGSSAGLPPDWIALNLQTGEPESANVGNLTTNYSYDALRTTWRIALDYRWFKEARAKTYLDKLGFLGTQWQEKRAIYSVYGHDGAVISTQEAPAMYGGSIGYFVVSDEEKGKEVYDERLKSLFNQDENRFKDALSYYDANWVWFGLGLYNNLLPNLAEK
jgi:endo-1,4-beta-D-glucanase Y